MNPQLIQKWYETHRVGLYRFALSILRSPQQAEDVLQETFLFSGSILQNIRFAKTVLFLCILDRYPQKSGKLQRLQTRDDRSFKRVERDQYARQGIGCEINAV